MRPWLALAFAGVLPAAAAGQSLGEVARKERERQEKLRKAGAEARTLTDADLASTKGVLANDPSAAPEDRSSKAGQAAGETSPAAPRVPSAAAKQPVGLEEHWRARAAHVRSRIERARRARDAYQSWIRFGQPVRLGADGRGVVYSPGRLKRMADAAEAEHAAAEQALERLQEEARRAGVPPGWLR